MKDDSIFGCFGFLLLLLPIILCVFCLSLANFDSIISDFWINKVERKAYKINDAVSQNDFAKAHKCLNDLSVFCQKIERHKCFEKSYEMASLYNGAVESLYRDEISYVLASEMEDEFIKKKVISLLLELESTPILYGERNIILSNVYDYVSNFAETIGNKEIAKYVKAKKKELTKKK